MFPSQTEPNIRLRWNFSSSYLVQIRREYQKIVKDSWLPQCLLCNVDTSEDQGPSASPTNNALSANVLLPTSNVSTKKKPGPETANVAGTFLSGSPIHQPHNQTSTLMRHHHASQRKYCVLI